MKEYIINDRDAAKYIRDVRKGSNGTYVVEFADGRTFTNIEASQENLEKIIATQEAQAEYGIKNYAKFRDEEKASRRRTFFSGIGAMAVGTGLAFIPAVQNALSSQSPLTVVAGIGAITILGALPAYARLRRDKSRMVELDKLRYRNSHLAELDSFREYPNALSSVNPRVANWMRQESDPFCILNVDSYSKEDLEQIVENIHVEKQYDFTYPKRKLRGH